MSNYLEDIENEYSKIRGRFSPIAPIDWHLAESWEKKGIPLSVVLRAMSETGENFKAGNRKGTINTLRYFEQEVEKQFADYCAVTVGKSDSTAPDGEATAETDDEILACQKCVHYHTEKGSDNFYEGWCESEAVWMIEDGERYPDIAKARMRCNPECDDEDVKNYQFFQQKPT